MTIYQLIFLFNCLIITITTSMHTYENDFRYISYQDIHQSSDVFWDKSIFFYSQLLFDVARSQVLVGARDALFRLSLSHLQILENSTWLASNDKTKLCLAKGQSEENCHNYIKVLLTDSKKIFTCGTNAFSPSCSWREIENISKVSEWVDGIAKCPYNPSSNITALMTENGDYFVGGPTDFHGSDSAIYRNLGHNNVIRTQQYNSMWLNEPQFVGSFETDKFIYFFLREAAVEYINCGKIVYSRIARVCKNDQGGHLMLKDNWTTFLKARLNCSISGDYPAYFDEIQSIVYVPESNVIYGTFTTPTNSIAGSAICAFNLTAIDSAFSGPFKSQHNTDSSWDKHYSQHQDHFKCKPSTLHNKYVLESSKYQLMDNAVQATTLSPLFVSQLERFTHISIDVISTKLHSSIHILYVATLDGLIKKLTILPRTQKSCVVEIWQATNGHNPIVSLQYLKETNSLYIGTKNNLMKVPAAHCKRHGSRESCRNAMDPYCGWNELDDSCTLAPNENPLTKHWFQTSISCPKLDAPVDGGWSSWSSWEPCQLKASSSSDSTDECVCQTRQCNNPGVKNGGKGCVGHSIAVTNCTVHGDWTPWSAWSACSATCGVAVKTRRRTCSNPTPSHKGRVCVGQDRSEVLCAENPPCPLPTVPPQDGQWSNWDDWTKCTVSCGGGFRKRSRKCNSPYPQHGGQDCDGSSLDYEICNEHPCSEQKRHAPWTPWFLSNVSNGHTVEHRYKYSCKGPVQDSSQLKIFVYKEEERTCSDGFCSSGNFDDAPKWTSWGTWTECSVSCGVGLQIRSRMCKGRGECQGLAVQTKKCNLKECPTEWSCWTDWSLCSVSCGLGTRQRTRSCLKDECDGESIQKEPCQGPSCESVVGWTDWSSWSSCDENNQQKRQRKCTNLNLDLCRGSNEEVRACGSEFSNDLNLMQLKVEAASMSAGTVVGCVISGIVIGALCSVSLIYFYFRKRKPYLPSSPHYISAKQNPYITVPLQELPSRKQSCSTSTTLNNSHNSGTTKSSKCYDYDTATIKRNSHGLNNGHMKSDNYYYD